MTGILALKLFLVPSLIYAVTLAGRRWGPMVAGWLSAFPVVSGPILLAVTLEQGSDFGANAAEGTLLAVVAILVFSLSYAWASNMFGVLGSMSSALAAYAIAVVVLQSTHLPVTWCFAVVISALLIVPKFFPHLPAQPLPSKSGLRDLPWRMLAGAMLVLLVTFAAARLGARLSGFLAMFPVMSTVLVGFSHHYSGRSFALALLRGMVLGYFAFATFCLIVSLLLRDQPVAAAFSLALLGALIVQLSVKGSMNRDRHTRAVSGGGGGAA
jgi:hypothetical protein